MPDEVERFNEEMSEEEAKEAVAEKGKTMISEVVKGATAGAITGLGKFLVENVPAVKELIKSMNESINEQDSPEELEPTCLPEDEE